MWPDRNATVGRWFDAIGTVLWFVFGLSVVVLVALEGARRSVLPAYRLGSERFFAGSPLYDVDIAMGYLYPPGFAALTAPFWSLGVPFDEVIWRILGFAVLTFALFRQTLALGGEKRLWTFSVAAFFAIPLCAGAMRNGQTTIILAGACWLMLLAARENRAAPLFVWTIIAAFAKPTAIVVILLVAAMRPRFIPILLLAVAIVFLIPFGFAPPAYVLQQTGDFLTLLTAMSAGVEKVFVAADFTAPLIQFGFEPSKEGVLAIRLVAALGVLVAVLAIDRRWRGPAAQGTLAIVVIAFFYMTVFNPRVEHNTYALIALPFALVFARMIARGRYRVGWALAVVLMMAGMTGVHRSIMNLTEFWFAPVIATILFAVLVVIEIVDGRGTGRRTEDALHATP